MTFNLHNKLCILILFVKLLQNEKQQNNLVVCFRKLDDSLRSIDTSLIDENTRNPDLPVDQQIRIGMGIQYDWNNDVTKAHTDSDEKGKPDRYKRRSRSDKYFQRTEENEKDEFGDKVHETMAYFTLFLVSIPIMGVLVSSLVPRENAIKAMIIGITHSAGDCLCKLNV